MIDTLTEHPLTTVTVTPDFLRSLFVPTDTKPLLPQEISTVYDQIHAETDQAPAQLASQLIGLIFSETMRAHDQTDPMACQKTVRFLTQEAFNTDAASARRQLWDQFVHYTGTENTASLVDNVLVLPETRHPDLIVHLGVFEYYGHTLSCPEITQQEVLAEEIGIGVINFRHPDGHSLGFIYADPEVIAQGQTEFHSYPPDQLFQQISRDTPDASPEEITDFLDHYHDFWSPDSLYAYLIGAAYPDENQILHPVHNLSIVSPQAKFLLYRTHQENPSEAVTTFLRYFDQYPLAGTNFILPAIHNRHYLYPLIELTSQLNLADPTLLAQEDNNPWYNQAPNLSPKELIRQINHTFGQESSTAIEPRLFLAQMLNWSLLVEGGAVHMAQTLLRSDQNTEAVQGFAASILHRNRHQIGKLSQICQHNPQILTENSDLTRYLVNGIKAHMFLVNLLAYRGDPEVAAAIQLREFFFQELRSVTESHQDVQVFLESMLEIWQAAYIEKDNSTPDWDNMLQKIQAFWAQHAEVLKSGAETGDTQVEIQRDESVLIKLQEQGKLPQEASVIDFGCGTGRRRLGPFLSLLKKYGVIPIHPNPVNNPGKEAVGIDISTVTDPLPEMELKPESFLEAGQDPDLRGKCHFAKCDWSAISDEARLEPQLQNFVAISETQPQGGILILDTAFPEGMGSYDEALRAYHALYPDAPEGRFNFDYASDGETSSKTFLLLYYESLFKAAEDAGYRILNLPDNPATRAQLIHQIIRGDITLADKRDDVWERPVWQAQGRPRITLVCEKIKPASATDNLVQKMS